MLSPEEKISPILHHLAPDTARDGCIHLGFFTDRETWHTFPSEQNHCHLGGHPHTILELHQEQYCLSAQCQSCPLLIAAQAGNLPRRSRLSLTPIWIQRATGAAFIWALLGWMVQVVMH